jgi:clan AA aspartic protease
MLWYGPIMGAVYATLDLENTTDADNAMQGLRPPDRVRRFTLRALVDTGAVLLVLPEDVVDHLGLTRRGKSVVSFADERKADWERAGPVTVRVANRTHVLECLVGPPTSEALLGQIPLEALDVLVDPLKQQLVARPESPIYPLHAVK